VAKARAHGAAETKYIPAVIAFARYSYQYGVPFAVHKFGTFGAHVSYDLFDRRPVLVRERRAELSEEEALESEGRSGRAHQHDLLQAPSNPEHGRRREGIFGGTLENARLTEDQFKHGIMMAYSPTHRALRCQRAS
jgi:hypothetical protein